MLMIWGTLKQFAQFLTQADFVVVILPLTPETEGVINAMVLTTIQTHRLFN